MKRSTVCKIIAVVLLSLFVFSGSALERTASAGEGGLESYLARVKPLEKTVKLRVGIGAGILHDFPAYAAFKMGGLKNAGVDIEHVYFANGPLMVEAFGSNAIDVAGYGVGGVLAGSVKGVHQIIQTRMNEAVVQKYFAKKTSDIVKDGINPGTGFYGKPDTWKGKAIYVPPGTTLQYLLGVAVTKMGMTMDDVNPVFMDAPNVNTALYAGKGEVWGLWNLFGYAKDIQDDYVELFSGKSLGITFMAASVARKTALDDPDLKAAIGKWIECQFAVIEWMQAKEENMNEAVEIFYQWTQEEGVKAEKGDLLRYMKDATFFTLEENYKFFTEKGASGMIPAREMALSPMDFFISNGNYTEDDKAKIADDRFNVEFIEAAMKAK
jgi:ABC-type nitrate/sulfonate/bicarbonate transport system substrate-binding protein